MELRSGKLVLIVGFVAAIAAILLAYVLISVLEDNDSGSRTVVTLMMLGFGGFAAYFLLHYYRYRILINDYEIIIQNEFGKHKTILQEDIVAVDYQRTFNMILIKTRWGQKFKISNIYLRMLELIPEEKFTERLIRTLTRGNSEL